MAGTLRDATHSRSPRLPLSAWLAMVLMAGAVSLIAYYAPEDAVQGLSQRIWLTFCVGWAALLSLASTLYRLEHTGKRIDLSLRELKELRA